MLQDVHESRYSVAVVKAALSLPNLNWKETNYLNALLFDCSFQDPVQQFTAASSILCNDTEESKRLR
jgi:hypothetical protein